MKNKAALAHPEFVSLITTLDKVETIENIRSLREQDASLNSLFEIIEEMEYRAKMENELPSEMPAPKSFDEIEDLLIKVFSGDYQDDEAQKFISGMVLSPLFYQRALLKLRQLAMVTASEDVPEMANVQIKSNQEILESFILTAHAQDEEMAPSRKERNILESFLEKLQNLLFPANALPKYALAFATVIFLGIMIPNISSNLGRQNLLENYLISVNYDGSALRAGSTIADGSAEQQNFLSNFELAMGDFVTGDYLNAIQSFKALEPAAGGVRSVSRENNLLSLLRNYYFYYGYSHLALAKPGLIDFKETNEKEHLQEATRLFLNANSIAEKHNLDNLQRENYFIALATGLSGNKESAVQMLRQIHKGSGYFKDAERLIQEWAN